METENLIHCEKNTHGGSIYVYVQPVRAEDSPVLLQELVLPESANDVGKIVTDGAFIVASLINHGADTNEGPGAVIVYKKRNNGLFSYLQTIEAPLSTVEISVETNLDFGIDMVITDDNLIITTEPTLASTDSHSYIAIYEYGEFYWELVQEIFNDEKLNEKSYVSDTFTSVYGGEHSLVADNNNLIFKSYALYDNASTGSYAFLHASKIIGTFVIDFDNPIRHPQEEGDASIKTLIENNSHNLFGDPKLYNDYLMIPSVEFIDSANYVPAVLIYKRNEQGKFVYTSTLSYAVEHKLTSLDSKITHSVMLAGSHMIIRGDNLPDAYYELDEDDQTWKVSTDETFDVFNNKLYLGGCPVCHGDEPECKDVKLHLQLTNDITEISDVCLDGVTYSDGCEAEYLLIQPKSGDVSIIDYGSGSRLITPNGAAGITTITNICDTPPIAQSTPTPTETCNPTELQFVMTSNLTNTLSNRNATTEDDDLTIDAVAYSLPIENVQSGEGLHATEIPVTFSSSDENIVSVVDNGTKLSTTGVGTATITANVVGNCTYLSDVETQVQNGHPDYTGKTFTVTVSLAPTPTPTLSPIAQQTPTPTETPTTTPCTLNIKYDWLNGLTGSGGPAYSYGWTRSFHIENGEVVRYADGTEFEDIYSNNQSYYYQFNKMLPDNVFRMLTLTPVGNFSQSYAFNIQVQSDTGTWIDAEVEYNSKMLHDPHPQTGYIPITYDIKLPDTKCFCSETEVISSPSNSIGDEHPDFIGAGFNGVVKTVTGQAISHTHTTNSWYSYDNTGGEYKTTGVIGQSFSAPQVVTHYRIYPWNWFTRDQDPKNWTLEASNDNFNTVVILDTQTDAVFDVTVFTSSSGNPGVQQDKAPQPIEYNINNTDAYMQYRLNITSNNGNQDYLVIQEIEFWGCEDTSTPTPTQSPIAQQTPTPTETPTQDISVGSPFEIEQNTTDKIEIGYVVGMNDTGDRVLVSYTSWVEKSSFELNGTTHLTAEAGLVKLRVYEKQAENWIKIGDDIVRGERDYYKADISSDGSRVLVAHWDPYQWKGDATYANPTAGGTSFPLIKIYELSNNAWTLLGEPLDFDWVTIAELFADQYEGWWERYPIDFAWSGDFSRVVITESAAASQSTMRVGRFKVFSFDNGSWSQVGNTPYGPEIRHNGFGYNIVMSKDGNTIGMSTNGAPSGRPYKTELYRLQSNEWVLVGSPLLLDHEILDNSGLLNLNADGTRLVVGRYNMVVYDFDGQNYTIVGDPIMSPTTLQGSPHPCNAKFSDDGNRLVIDAPGWDASTAGDGTGAKPNLGRGLILVFDLIGNEWIKCSQEISNTEYTNAAAAASLNSRFGINSNADKIIVGYVSGGENALPSSHTHHVSSGWGSFFYFPTGQAIIYDLCSADSGTNIPIAQSTPTPTETPTEIAQQSIAITPTGADQIYVVPSNITEIKAQLWGAGGSQGCYPNGGGAGGYTAGTIPVTPGETLIIGTGETTSGDTSSTFREPGYSPGGSGGSGGNGNHKCAGAGGGMSGIFRGTISAENALLIAGGGGGAAGSGTDVNAGGGAGGGLSGNSGMRYANDTAGGPGGTQTNGGSSVCGNGTQFTGGNGDTYGDSSGGGGGAGWFGGAAGCALSGMDSSGGGGSGYVSSEVTDGITIAGQNGNRNGETSKSHKPSEIISDGYDELVQEAGNSNKHGLVILSETDSSQSSSNSELNCVDIRNNINDMVSDEVCCYYGETHKIGVGPIDQRCKIVAPSGGMDTYTPTLDYTTHDYTTNSYLNETEKLTGSGNLKLCDTANLELKYVDYGQQTINLNESGSDQEVRSIFGYSLKIKHGGYSSDCTPVPFFVEAVNSTTGEIFEIGEYTYERGSFNYANNSVTYFSGNTNGKKYIETSAGTNNDVELIIPADPVGITLYVTLCDMYLGC